ncbi:DUF4833 domain-containing protein [Faecalibacter bovis]|uniref:DUF4833 domain-containing protein n=1 Tax=Faecalibacter bovis TaxID=2898187 RepID=A0ABX7XGC3_9FLAO|nr:DUF4833 domain-containing protein [Faecalibacter bovis]QTV06917.1 DUF4833 domain-containing protein [Faecalibacter bovis]
MYKFLLLLFFSFQFLNAQEGYPKPTITENLLFYIQHSSNHNTFIYEWNGSKSAPINAFRINYEDNGQKEELTSVQRKFAYGVNYTNASKSQFYLAATKKIILNLKSVGDKHWVEVTIGKQKIKIDHIFIQLQSKSNGINVKADYILIYGKNQNNKSIVEKIVL